MPGAHVADADGAIMKIPPELICHIASLLPVRALFRAALVCSPWRAVLLASPALWTCIRVAFGGRWSRRKRGRLTNLWEPLLDAYLTRSEQLPLTIDIAFGDAFASPNYAERMLRKVAAWVRTNMHRVKALSVTLSRFQKVIPVYLTGPAPILEFLCLRARSPWVQTATGSLFAGHAPLLGRIEISGGISLQGEPFARLQSITQLCYKGEGRDASLRAILVQLPSLRRLTLDIDPVQLEQRYHNPLDLQVRVQTPWDASLCFPNARSICYALGRPHAQGDDEVSTPNLAVTLRRLWKSAPKSLEMRLSRQCVRPVADTGADIRMSVMLDGVYIAVDVHWMCHARLIQSVIDLRGLERLVLHYGIWGDFTDLDLPRLAELTIHLRRPLNWRPLEQASAAHHPWALRVLRLARSPLIEDSSALTDGDFPAIKAADIAALVSRHCEPRALRKLVLRGWNLEDSGTRDLHWMIPNARVVYEDEVACDEWVQPTGWSTSYIDSQGLQI